MKSFIEATIYYEKDKCLPTCHFFNQPGGGGSSWALCSLFPNAEMGTKPNLLTKVSESTEWEHYKSKFYRHRECIEGEIKRSDNTLYAALSLAEDELIEPDDPNYKREQLKINSDGYNLHCDFSEARRSYTVKSICILNKSGEIKKIIPLFYNPEDNQ